MREGSPASRRGRLTSSSAEDSSRERTSGARREELRQSVRNRGTATRFLLTFAFGLPLALGLLAVVYLAGFAIVLFLLVPLLVVLIYLLPGHGEAPPPAGVRFCWQCGQRVEQVPGTGFWRCGACGNTQELGP